MALSSPEEGHLQASVMSEGEGSKQAVTKGGWRGWVTLQVSQSRSLRGPFTVRTAYFNGLQVA